MSNNLNNEDSHIAQKDKNLKDNVNKKNARNREEERARRREKRRKQVLMYRICTIAVVILIVCGGGGALIYNLPSLKLSRKLSAGNKYTQNGDYDKANDSYEEALKIDSGTVEAYRSMANNDIELNDSKAAKEILYTGWENTQDESLLHYYCVVVLNEAVAQINNKKCSAETIDKCLQVLQIENDNEDALNLLNICYERLYSSSDEGNVFKVFLYDNDIRQISLNDIIVDGISLNDDSKADTLEDDMPPYEKYENQLRTMLNLYEDTGSEKIGKILAEYAIIDIEYIYLKVDCVTKYRKLLEDIYAAIQDKDVEELIECLSNAIKIEEDFANVFTEFAQGNYESAKDFIVSDTYIEIRDSFINGDSSYWEGSSLIPINQERIVIHNTPEGFKFFWPDYDDINGIQGVITVWGSRQLDDGVQRTTISYEPASIDGEYYPHTEYVISYEYSNVLKNGTNVQMNYRLNTTTTTEEGSETEAIGDWGGEHEWTTSY